ncbi:MAG: hypothetical protein SFV32_02400 [Opitutaceae bacterium]|nr:hypothetical protein [Opitutaceae bacterium]
MDQLVVLLQKAFPRGTEFEIVYDSENLQLRTVSSGGSARADGLEEILEDELPEAVRPGLATTSLLPIGQKGRGQGSSLWVESEPFAKVLAELLPTRNRQRLSAVWPWTQVLSPSGERFGRASLSICEFPNRVLVTGWDVRGEVVRVRIDHAEPAARVAELLEVMTRAGVNLGGFRGLPANLYHFLILDAEAPSLLQTAESRLSISNHWKSVHLTPSRASRMARKFKPECSLLRRSLKDRAGAYSLHAQVGAALAVLCAALFFWMNVVPLQLRSSQLLAQEAQLQKEKERMAGLEKQLSHLDMLYAKDAGWAGGVPQAFLNQLDGVFPRDCSLEEVVWDEKGRLLLRAKAWTSEARARNRSISESAHAVISDFGSSNRGDKVQFDEELGEFRFGGGI